MIDLRPEDMPKAVHGKVLLPVAEAMYNIRAFVAHHLGSNYEREIAPYKKAIADLVQSEHITPLAAMKNMLKEFEFQEMSGSVKIPGVTEVPQTLTLCAGLELAEEELEKNDNKDWASAAPSDKE